MPTEKGLSNLIINKVESKEVYNYMVANNLVNEDEMYLVQGDDEVQIIVDSALNTTSENPVQNKVVATAINNLNTLVGDTPVSDQINTAVASKADASDLTAHTGNSNIHITSTERTNWNAAKAHADSAHAPSNAEENQNAFSNIIVGGTTIAADSKTDTLTIVAGNNVTLTPDAKNDKLTITAKDTVYTHPTYTARGTGLYKVTVDGTGHVSEVTNVVKDDIVALGIPAQDTTYNEATTSAAGLMSASDKTKLNGIADGANKTIVDSALSSTSTNPVQNKVVNTAISNLNTLVGDKSVAAQISTAIANKSDSDHTHDDRYYTKTEINSKLNSKSDTDHTHDDRYYTETEIDTKLSNKVDKVEGSRLITTSEATKLESLVLGDSGQVEISGKVNASNVEGLDELLATKVDKVTGMGLSTNDYTINEKNKLSGIATGAEVNQNAFSNVVVGSTTIAADSKTDSLTIVAGNNITITPDAANDKLTIAATDTVYTHPTYTSKKSGLYKITVDGTGHVSATTAVSKSDITALGIPAQDTTYSTATQSANGLMSSGDKTKLDGIETGANKTVIDSELSSTSTNPVQNKAVNTAISSLNTLIGDKSVASQITSAIDALNLDSTYIAVTQKGTANGVAELDSNGKVPSNQLPSYVDDVLEYTAKSNFPSTGEAGKIYVDTSTNLAYRWGGSTYAEISPSITLGTTSSTAFRGDYGNTAYIHANAKGSAFTSGLYKITTNAQGHVTAATAVVKSDITGLGIPEQDTTYSTVTTSAAGLMSAADKSKLDGIATGANKTTVDSTLSSTSTNPVQNKVVNTAISTLNTLVGDTPVATQITSAINDAGFLTVDLNNTESGTAPFTNSDMLGGLPPSSYLQVANFPQALTDAGVVKSVAGKTPNASGEVALVPADIGAVPTSRTVNGKALSSDISLTYSDVGAAAGSHTHTIYSLQSIGTNPITSTADDTSTNWGNRGTCVCFYSTAGCLIDQPSQYGILVSFSQGTEVHQIWMIQPSGKVYHRGANASGWNGTWKNMVDASCFSLSGTTLTITTT